MKLFKVVNYLLVLSLFLQMVPASVYASNTKTITVNFSSPPTTAVASKLPLKYGKSFAYSWMFDDGLSDAYRNAFRYLNGGIVDVQSTSLPYPGLYYTDGAGNDVPFRAGYAWYSVNGAFTDLHYDTPGNITYGELRDSYDNGWDVINHGWQSIATPSPANTIINYPAGNGGPRTIDYPYEISQNNNTVKAKLGISKDMSQFALPSGDQLYVDSALADSNIRSVMSQSTTFSVGGSTVTLPHGVNAIDVNPLISSPTGLDDYLMYRKLYSSPTGPDPTADSVYYADADNTYSFSTGGANYWRQAFTHRVYNGVGAMGANFYWTKFKAVVDHIEANYGKSGNDTAWVAGQQEVYEYLLSNQKTDLSQNLSGSTLTITLDTTNVPDSLRRKALSLRVEADTPISSIVYSDGEFTYTSHNTATGLINLDWGEHYSGNLNMHVESALSTAEKSLVLTDKDKAQLWIDLLPSGSEQTVFQNRLDAIPAAERTFQFALTNASTSGGVWNTYSKLLTTDPTLSNVQTIDAVVTSLTLRTVQNFSSKLDGGTLKGSITSNNTGAFPDTYMRQGFVSASGVTSTLRLSNLNTSKLYAFKLLGSTIGRTAGYNAASTSNYQIAGSNTASGSLNAFQNFQNTFTAKGIAPTVGGTIDITISPADGAGAAYLNAFTLTEVTPPPVSSLSASPATINQGDSTTLTWSSTNSTSCSASWTNSTATSGTQVVSPVANTDYTVTCTGAGGSDDATTTVTVRPLPVSSLSASPATINQGDSTTLTWSSTNSTSCSASWTNSTATSGTQVVSPVANTDYTVTCTGAGGSDDATATVTVRPLPTATLSINPSIINSGESATLTWSSTNTTDCSASWTLSTAIFGSQSISPTSSGDYSITCNGAGGSISKLVSLVVLPVGGSGVSSAPIIVPPQSTENPQGGFRVTASQLPVSSSLPLVKLKFSVGSDINRIAISNYPDFNNANIELYQPEINWSLLNNNKFQKVYVKFYNKSGQSSEIIVGDIILDDIIESNSVQGTDIVSKIINEKTEIFNQANPETYFINNGTDSTLKLGSGERAAAISSYKEAYGIAPKTAANWIDVLNIANGRWPITVIKTVEARAYTNFKLVYGRNADMKNSTDVNALKMMGYGVRSTAARNLSAEKNAAQTFIKTFGFSPSIARHWNVIRAIAYSGLIK